MSRYKWLVLAASRLESAYPYSDPVAEAVDRLLDDEHVKLGEEGYLIRLAGCAAELDGRIEVSVVLGDQEVRLLRLPDDA